MSDFREDPDEEFPHECRTFIRNCKTNERRPYEVRYRFVEIKRQEGWFIYPGQECHEGKDGLIIEDCAGRWWEEDLWGARSENVTLDIGCYGGEQEYVCHAWSPDWHGKLLEKKAFSKAQSAAQWAEESMRKYSAES